jgi:hypothetical protein
MRFRLINNLTRTGVLVSSLATFLGQPAIAGTLYNGWNYAIDPSYDSMGSTATNDPSGLRRFEIGNGTNEIYGIALRDDPLTNLVWVAINANLPVTGETVGDSMTVEYPQAAVQAGLIRTNPLTFTEIGGGNIGWGDMFFDFSGKENFQQAQGNANFFAVRFSPNNESGVAPGVYSGVVGKNIAGRNPSNNNTISNAGFQNLYQHNTWLNALDPQNRDAWMGDLAWNNPYFNPYTQPGNWSTGANLMPNVISSGNRVGDVTIRNQAELVAQGFDLNTFFKQGSQVFGFSFEKPLGFVGDYFATLLEECLNDGVSLLGRVPPPLPAPAPTCPPPSLAQKNAIMPVRVNGKTKYFEDVPSNLWYDPPADLGYLFEATGGTVFTQILDFPCGIETNTGEDRFNVSVGGFDLGTFGPGQSLDFSDPAIQALLGALIVPGDNGVLGVKQFRISDINIDICQNCPPWENQFAAQLKFNDETGSFTMTPVESAGVPEPSTMLGLLLSGICGVGLRRLRKK